MATPTPEELNKQFEKLQRLATTLGKNMSSFNLRPVVEDATLVGELIEKWGKELDDSLSSVNDLASGFQSVVQEISQGNIGLAATKKTFNSLTSIAQQLSYEQAGINKLSEKELQTLLKKSQQARVDAKSNNDTLALRKAALIAENTSDTISLEQKKKNRAEITKITGAMADNLSIENGQSQTYKDLILSLESRLKLEEKIGKTMGIGGAAVEGIATALDKMGLGGLGKALGLDEAKAKMREVAEETKVIDGELVLVNNKWNVLGAGIKSAGSNLKTNLTDPLVVSTFLAKQFIDALQSVDNLAGTTAKQFNLSYQEASKLNSQLNNTANLSGDAAVNTKGLNESMMAVGKTLGSNAKLNDADLITFTKLREQAGYTNEELASIQTLSLANGKTLEDNTAEILGSAQAYASQNKLIVNEKEVLREVGKASASLKLSLGGSTAALAESVVKAKQFGLTLEQASKISSGLLNFEESISSEIEAELLTGKELNLEQARLLALNGKTAEAAAEVAKQVGSSAQFGKMNVIQQEAIAKSVGMGRDELAQSLIDKEALVKLSGKEGESAKEAFDRLVASVGYEEAKKQLGNDQLANQFKQQSAQEKLANITSKLQELFISIAEPVMAIVNPFITLATKILPLINVVLQPIVFAFKLIGDTVGTIFDWLSQSKEMLITMGSLAVGLGVAMNGVAITTAAIKVYQEAINISKGKGFIIEKGIEVVKGIQLGYEAAMGSYAARKALVEKGGLMRSIGEAAMKVVSSLSTIPIVGVGLGIAAAAATVALGMKYMDDGVIGPGGETVVSGPKGSIQLNKEDSIVAGTNLFDDKKSQNTSYSTSTPQSDKTTSPQIDLSPLMERINVLIDAVKAGGDVYLDATKVGTAMNVGTYKVQ